MQGHVYQHAPIEKDFGQTAHGIGVKDVDEGNGTQSFVVEKAWMQEFAGSSNDDPKGTSQPPIGSKGYQHGYKKERVEQGNGTNDTHIKVFLTHPEMRSIMQN